MLISHTSRIVWWTANAVLYGVCSICVVALCSGQSLDLNRKVLFEASAESILQNLLKFGLQERIPLGIAIDSSNSLCAKGRRTSSTGVNVSELVTGLLSGTDYKSFVRAGVIQIRPNRTSEAASHILDMKFEKFNGMNTTIQGLGIILSGWVWSQLHPGQGYAGDILASLDAEKEPPFTLQDASVNEILNHIVSLGSKGVWILSIPPDKSPESHQAFNLRTYGYKDDAKFLGTISCGGSM